MIHDTVFYGIKYTVVVVVAVVFFVLKQGIDGVASLNTVIDSGVDWVFLIPFFSRSITDYFDFRPMLCYRYQWFRVVQRRV